MGQAQSKCFVHHILGLLEISFINLTHLSSASYWVQVSVGDAEMEGSLEADKPITPGLCVTSHNHSEPQCCHN